MMSKSDQPVNRELLAGIRQVITQAQAQVRQTVNHAMVQWHFYAAIPIRDALRLELSWTNYRPLLRIESEQVCARTTRTEGAR